MVRLRAFAFFVCQNNKTRFQFHNGSVESNIHPGGKHYVNIFQFHNGSVERHGSDNKNKVAVSFQFHNGSVERQLLRRAFALQLYFNSTMVRLRVTSRIATEMFLFYFNSTMVRLRVPSICKSE